MEIIEKICKDAAKRDYGYIDYIELYDNGYVIRPCEEDGTSYADDILYLYDLNGSLIASDWGTVTDICGEYKQNIEVPEKYRYRLSESTLE